MPALGEGFANFGWLGFVLFALISFGAVVLVQEFFLRIRLGLISHALMSWYAYLALMISTNSIFATLISLIYTVAFGIIILAYLVAKEIFRIYPNINDRLHD